MIQLTRRRFLGSAAGVLGSGLAAGCSEKLPRFLVPFATPPDDVVPGMARFYRSTCRACPAGCGVTARVRDGRAVKLEGSLDNPVGRGALCPAGQASIESLYSPSRLAAPRAGERVLPWEEAETRLQAGLAKALESGRQIAILTRPERGRLGDLFGLWLAALGQAPGQVATFDPMDRAWLREGQRRAFGGEATPVHELAAAGLILSIGDDFVEEGSPVELARGFADQRAAGGRMVYVGPRLSLTAAAADDWIPVEPGSELALVLGLARQVLEAGGAQLPAELAAALRGRLAPYPLQEVAARTGVAAGVVEGLARSLLAAKPSLCLGPGRAVAGADAAALAEAVWVLNALLGNLGQTVRFLPAPAPLPSLALSELVRRAEAGQVGALILHHADPLGYGPAFAPLAAAMAKIPFVAAFTNELDATSRRAQLVLPDHHFLEAWSDVPIRPGLTGVQQPVMTPVLGSREAADVLLAAARSLGKATGLPGGTFGELVRAAYSAKEVELGVKREEFAPIVPSLSPRALAELPAAAPLRGPAAGLPLVVAPSLRSLDGRPARSALLQELPDPISGFSWTGWVELHPTTAATFGVSTGDVVAVEGPGGRVELPVFASRTVRAGLAAVPVSAALGLLEGAGGIGLGARVSIRPTGGKYKRPHVEESGTQHGRELARSVSRSAPRLPIAPQLPTMYPPTEHPHHRWGLAIDLDRCNGCSACTAACYVENNIPIVGADQVARGRSMSWLPIQAFVEDPPAPPAGEHPVVPGAPEVSLLPLPCQHCSAAPCEAVCPTFATYHSPEGLNTQIYARCIGTRYCENNCPYGVRRFNFYDVDRPPPSHLGQNPDVTIRGRGVTEKCSLCVQRIRGAEEQAMAEGRRVLVDGVERMEPRPLRDGEFQSACAAACPTQAIVFGDLKDPASRVSRLAADGRAYRLLEQLNTQPGVVYLARRRGGAT